MSSAYQSWPAAFPEFGNKKKSFSLLTSTLTIQILLSSFILLPLCPPSTLHTTAYYYWSTATITVQPSAHLTHIYSWLTAGKPSCSSTDMHHACVCFLYSYPYIGRQEKPSWSCWAHVRRLNVKSSCYCCTASYTTCASELWGVSEDIVWGRIVPFFGLLPSLLLIRCPWFSRTLNTHHYSFFPSVCVSPNEVRQRFKVMPHTGGQSGLCQQWRIVKFDDENKVVLKRERGGEDGGVGGRV